MALADNDAPARHKENRVASKMADGGKRKGSGNGFQGLGLSDPVYRGIVRMGFRVSFIAPFSSQSASSTVRAMMMY